MDKSKNPRDRLQVAQADFDSDLEARFINATRVAEGDRLAEATAILEQRVARSLHRLDVAQIAQAARLLDNAGLYNILDRILRHLLSQFPNDESLLYLYIRSAWNQGDLDAAMARGKLKDRHHDTNIVALLAKTAITLGDLGAAVEYIHQGLELDENLPELRSLIVRMTYFHECDYPLVVDLTRIWKHSIPPYLVLLGALSADHMGDRKTASTIVQDLIKSDPSNNMALLCGYELSRRREDYDQAATWMNKILENSGFAPISNSWAESDCRLEALRCDSPPASKDHRLVSVVMSVHRWHDLVPLAVWSILDQSHKALELIIVDDGSPVDDAADIERLVRSDERIRVEHLVDNRGTYVARNKGIARCSGEFITFMDSDDWAHPQRIQKALVALDMAPPFVVGVCDDCIRMRSDGEAIIRTQNPVVASVSLLARKQTFYEAGQFDAARHSADSEYLHRLKMIYGSGAVLPTRAPSLIATQRLDSLTGGGAHHIDWRGLSGDRFQYRQSFLRSHKVTAALALDTGTAATYRLTPDGSELNTSIRQVIDDHIETNLPNLSNVSQDMDVPDFIVPRGNDQPVAGPVTVLLVHRGGAIHGIDHALSSLLNQTSPPDEIVICGRQLLESRHTARNDVRILAGGVNLRDVTDTLPAGGVVLLAGDEILYPPNYVERITSVLQGYGKGVIIGAESMMIPCGLPPASPQEFQDAVRRQTCSAESRRDTLVNVLAADTLGFLKGDRAVSDIQLTTPLDTLTAQLAVHAQKTGTVMISMSRSRLWLRRLIDEDMAPGMAMVVSLSEVESWRTVDYE